MKPLRIAFAVNSFPKMSEIFLVHQANALRNRGHHVEFLAVRNPREDVVQSAAQSYLDEGLVRYAPKEHTFFSRCKHLPYAAGELGTKALLHTLNPQLSGVEAFSLFTTFRNVQFAQIQDLGGNHNSNAVDPNAGYQDSSNQHSESRATPPNFDIVHAQFGSIARQCAVARKYGFLRTPFVTSFRGNDMSGYLVLGSKNIYDLVFKESVSFFPVTQRWKAKMISMGCKSERIFSVPTGVPMQHVPRRTAGPWKNGTPLRIVSAGRLEKHKGVEFGLRAFSLIAAKYPSARMEIFGDGSQRHRLERISNKELGLGEKVRFHGHTVHDELLSRLPEFHLHLFTTCTSVTGRTEGIPNILKETQAAGVPAVAFSHPGVDEVIVPDQTGILVPEKDDRAMAREAMRLVESDSRWVALAEASSRHARMVFDVEETTTRFEALYEEAIAYSQ